MYRLLLFLLLLPCLSLNAQINYDEEFMNGSTLMLQEEMALVYEVDYYGTNYDFIVTILSFEDGIKFSYEMTNESKTNGTISISEDAFQNSLIQYNYFSGGDVKLESQTSVWVSQMIFQQLMNTGECRLSFNGEDYISLKNAIAKHDYEIDIKSSDEVLDDISYVYAESEDSQYKYWIHLSMYQPIVLRMDLGWKIWLKEIRL